MYFDVRIETIRDSVSLIISIFLVYIFFFYFIFIKATTATSSPINTISSTANWTGTFLMDNACDTTVCCCLYNQITSTLVNTYQIQIKGSVTGQCTAIGSSTSLLAPVSTSFQTIFSWGTQPIRLQLGRDNSYLAFISIGPGSGGCSTTGLRTS